MVNNRLRLKFEFRATLLLSGIRKLTGCTIVINDNREYKNNRRVTCALCLQLCGGKKSWIWSLIESCY